jgi:hypothetical protein
VIPLTNACRLCLGILFSEFYEPNPPGTPRSEKFRSFTCGKPRFSPDLHLNMLQSDMYSLANSSHAGIGTVLWAKTYNLPPLVLPDLNLNSCTALFEQIIFVFKKQLASTFISSPIYPQSYYPTWRTITRKVPMSRWRPSPTPASWSNQLA